MNINKRNEKIQKSKHNFNDIQDNLKIIKEISLSEIGIFLNADRRVIWKKIEKDKLSLRLFGNDIKLQLYRDENEYFYTTETEFKEFKQKVIETNKKYENYILFKEGINSITKFKNSIYKNIKDGKVKFLKNNNLIILNIYEIDKKLYLNKEELSQKQKIHYNKKTIIDFLKEISYDKIFDKKLNKNNEFELCFDDLDVKIKSIKFNSQYFFSELEISKIYYFVKRVKEKIEGLEKLKLPKKKYSKYLLYSSSRLFSKEDNIIVQLYKINNEYYYKKEDEEKIKELFN